MRIILPTSICMRVNSLQKIIFGFCFVGLMCTINFLSLDRGLALNFLLGSGLLLMGNIISILVGIKTTKK